MATKKKPLAMELAEQLDRFMKNEWLSPEQKEKMEVIEWLYGDDRASGRSQCQAFAIIKQAMHEAGRSIEVYDHYGTRDANRRLLIQCHSIIETYLPSWKENFSFTDRTIRYCD